MSEHSAAAVDVVTRLYGALASRDWSAAASCFRPDAVWHMPGDSAVAGDHLGWQAIRDDFLTRLHVLSGGTFRAELIDVAIGHRFVVAVQHATGNHQERSLDITGCQLIELRDGLISAVRGHYSDQAALDAFWGPKAKP